MTLRGANSRAGSSRAGTWRDAGRLAVGTLTALRVRPPTTLDRRTAGRAMLLAPAVGAGLGLAAGAVAWGAPRAGLSPLVAATVTLGLLALATRGLHLDGLADTADGLAASYDRERALAVMRRGDVGPSGAATLVLVLLVQVAALSQALDRSGPWQVVITMVIAVVISRLALPIACLRGVPAARADGLGATVSGSVPRSAAAVVVVLTVAAITAVALMVGSAAPGPLGSPGPLSAGHPHPWQPAVAAAVALLITALLVRRAVTRLGGITGDVLGACVEAALTAALVVLAAA